MKKLIFTSVMMLCLNVYAGELFVEKFPISSDGFGGNPYKSIQLINKIDKTCRSIQEGNFAFVTRIGIRKKRISDS